LGRPRGCRLDGGAGRRLPEPLEEPALPHRLRRLEARELVDARSLEIEIPDQHALPLRGEDVGDVDEQRRASDPTFEAVERGDVRRHDTAYIYVQPRSSGDA